MIALLGLFSLMVALTILFGLQALAASRRQTRARPEDVAMFGHFNRDSRWGWRR